MKKVIKKKTVNKKKIVESLLKKVWSNGELDLVEEFIANEYTLFHDPGDPWDGKIITPDIYKKRVLLARKIFPDLQFLVQELAEDKNKVIVSWFMTGSQQGDLPQLPATGNKINVSGITFYYFNKAKIAGHWQVFDRLEMIKQLRASKTNPQS